MQQLNLNRSFQLHPTQLSEKRRAKHVFNAILKYNQGIIENNIDGAHAKFERLKLSPFIFMRGTADLMYQDLVGTDDDKALVFCVGDVHLENFGVMKCGDEELTWDTNDFDEATFAPFTWDVKRGAVSVFLAATDNRFSKKETQKLTKVFAKSYLKHIEIGFSKKSNDYLDSKLIKKLLRNTRKINASDWLCQNYLDAKSEVPVFKETDEIKPLKKSLSGERLPIIQKAINQYLSRLQKVNSQAPKWIRVLDLATKTGSGTASVGLWRYYILVEIQKKKQSELMILEMKQMRPSVLKPYAKRQPLIFASEGERVNFAENIHLKNANPYYGYTELEGLNYLVRERSPYKSRIKLQKLKKYKDFKSYVEACGNALAHAHLLSNAAHYNKKQTSKAILNTIDKDIFTEVITSSSIQIAKQVIVDWKSFCKKNWRLD